MTDMIDIQELSLETNILKKKKEAGEIPTFHL